MEQIDTVEKMLINQGMKQNKPVSATLEITPLCNMDCDMCYVHLSLEMMKEKGEMLRITQWKKIIKQMAAMGVLFITITGGEPLLHPDFKEIYLLLKKMGMIITINTNGTLIDDKWVDFFAAYPPRRINITVYGCNEATYKKICHVEGYQKTIKAIESLTKHQLKVKINGSIVKDNYDQIDDFYQLAKKLNVPIHLDTYMLPGLKDQFKPFDKQARLNPKQQAIAHLKVLQNESSDFNHYVTTMLQTIDSFKEQIRTITCQATHSSFAINFKGDMMPCVSLTVPASNIIENGLENSWQELITKSKQLLINEKCATCKLKPICNTCVASALWESGNYQGIGEYNCLCAKEMYQRLKEINHESSD